jgi:hypothetical protein
MAIDFDGVNDYVDCGSAASLDNIWAADGSAALWVNIDAIPADGASFRLAGKNNISWIIRITNVAGAGTRDNVLNFYTDRVTTDGEWDGPDEGFTSAAGTWKHIVVTYNGSSVANNPILYVDGASVSVTGIQTPNGAMVSDAAANLELGRSTSENVNGRLEDIRLYKRILAPKEVATLAAGYRGPLGGEVLWLSGNDFAGVTHPDGTTLTTSNVMSDLSGNGNDGVPTNSPIARASEAPRYYWWSSLLVGGGTSYAQAVSGTLTTAGALTKKAKKALSGTVGFYGTFSWLRRLLARLTAPWKKTGLTAQQADTTLTAPMIDTDLRGEHE